MVEVEKYKGYFVTDDGRVWSSKTNRYLKMQKNRKGYYIVKLTNSRKDQKTIAVHRLVANAYLNASNHVDKQVNHIDGNKENNSASNLELLTCKDNIIHSWRIGLHSTDNRKGENNNFAKLNDKSVADIKRRLKTGETQISIAKLYKVDNTLISMIKRGKAWQHVA